MRWPNDFVNKVICGDALRIIQFFPDERIDMIILGDKTRGEYRLMLLFYRLGVHDV